ncbi:Acetate CoA-transferase YdiF [Pseudovibrio axinellae]|uniref:Acetate CoA-transferase YdiF n=1 Tax=Pseudovibrio axinellae TaxID=989403 RepID=A0A165YBB0_9HYPH|nr:CoA-transferase [Pseudovibrio axinellae]KZL18634.1 Acetate CoA-transferase YdiF [Pseudovibrio axinellae]SER73838.1 propionate CoA-transferase [Pseudovibrio axinellae]
MQICSAREIAAFVQDGDTIVVSGCGWGLATPETLLEAIEQRFLSTGHPKNLFIVNALSIGDGGKRGLNRFAHKGMLRGIITSELFWTPSLQKLVYQNKIEAYCLPAGVIQQLLREVGAGRSGLITSTGLDTFVDPRQSGGKCSTACKHDLVELLHLHGREYLRYRPFKVDLALICGSVADLKGNISLNEEAVTLDCLHLAMAAHNSGGHCFAQIRDIVEAGTLPARSVTVPGVFIDALVEAPAQTIAYDTPYSPALSGAIKPSHPRIQSPLHDLARSIIAQRAAQELIENAAVHVGPGIPAGMRSTDRHHELVGKIWLSCEQGHHNGQLLGDTLYGAARGSEALLTSLDQYDFYSGGGLDIAFLGMSEVDHRGNVNISKVHGKVIGPGSFIDISQNTRKLVFCGLFTGADTQVKYSKNKLKIVKNGSHTKFVERTEHITFNAVNARKNGQEVLYITERAVFQLGPNGLILIETAPGIKAKRDVLAHMGFACKVDIQRKMPEHIFNAL